MGEGPKIVEKSQPNINALTLNMDKLDCGHSLSDSGLVNLCLNIQIGCGPDGVWSVRHASVIGPTNDQTTKVLDPKDQPNTRSCSFKPTKPIRPSKPIFVWRLRSGSRLASEAGPSHSTGWIDPTDPDHSLDSS